MRKKLTGIACVLAMVLSAPVMADEYSEAYNCGIEAFTYGASSASEALVSCIGNSYDPSPLQEKAYADAERDFKSGEIAQANQCPFEFGIWIANGSRSDGFEEGAQLLNTLEEVTHLLASGREVFLYNGSGNKLRTDVANRWFARKGSEVVLTIEASKQCPDKMKDTSGS